jgi:hypothetical protein
MKCQKGSEDLYFVCADIRWFSEGAKHISILILVDACASALGFYIAGYAFAFGDLLDWDGNNIGKPCCELCNIFCCTNRF